MSKELRENATCTACLSRSLRGIRAQNNKLAGCVLDSTGARQLAETSQVKLFDCKQTLSLPGLQVKDPENTNDAALQRTFNATAQMAAFLREVFHRNSIDHCAMTLVSSVHYGKQHNNAMWNGLQMIYGDGDNRLFVDFTLGLDVIGHELAHGITQYTLQLVHCGEPGGLNESLSDCFGAMFRQWRLQQGAAHADWRIDHVRHGAAHDHGGFRGKDAWGGDRTVWQVFERRSGGPCRLEESRTLKPGETLPGLFLARAA